MVSSGNVCVIKRKSSKPSIGDASDHLQLATKSSMFLLYHIMLFFTTTFHFNMSAAFDFRAIFRRAFLRPGMTVMVWLMSIVAGIIGALGVIVVGIGLFFTLPYAFAVTANLYGQFSQRTRRAVAPD